MSGSTIYAPNGAIATSQPLASSAGLAVLQQGGNAVDAAVTAAAVLNVVEPHMTGIGGDMFAILWWEDEGELIGLNASGGAGSLMTREELLSRSHASVPATGAEAITVPGALAGWSALLERYGTISLADALRPAVELATEGFPVTPIIARQWAAESARLEADEGARSAFLIDGDRAPGAGERFVNTDLAATLRSISERGVDVLYSGELGSQIVQRVQELGGFLTLGDLEGYTPDWVSPMSVDYKGHRVWELPPNGQGIAALEMLRILEPFDLRRMGHNSAPYLHHLIEATKLAFADLARWVGDADQMSIAPDDLLKDAFIESRRALIDATRAAMNVAASDALTASETIYLSASDALGNMISFINSIYWGFGSAVVVPGTGFALQNRGAGFTLEPGLANTVGPGKRPFHTIIPAFVTRPASDGTERPWLSFGVMGGSMQPQGHVQILLDLLLFDMDLQEAIDAPRFRCLDGLDVALEPPIGDSVRRELGAMGHVIVPDGSVAFGGTQAVMRLDRGWAAGSDPRKDGMALGY